MTEWHPYNIGEAQRMRPLATTEGLADRLRLVAFAERQAARAFEEAAIRFVDAPMGLRDAWRWVAQEERKHENWLLEKLQDLGESIDARPVTLDLYHSFTACSSAREFSLYMADAEERGRVAGERFGEVLSTREPQIAAVFAQIAREEKEHVALVSRFFE